MATGCGLGEQTPREQFEADVIPVLEQSCASSTCHGVPPLAELSGEVIEWERFFLSTDDAGRIINTDQAYTATLRAINTDESPAFSSLLRKPLSSAYGGQPHHGGENFESPETEEYLAIAAWIARETDGGEVVAELDEYEQRFADEVQPVLAGAGCMNASCHGVGAAVPFRFDPGVDGEFSRAGTRGNYNFSLKMLTLDGAPELSRLVRKMLPLHDGGIIHKGGNSMFGDGPSDPRIDLVVEWACAEQERRVGLSCGPTPSLDALVFVRGEVAPTQTFDLDVYAPGTDIYLARLSGGAVTEIENLTGALHDGGGDARDPAVDATGTRLAFALRLSEDEGHEIYEMDLETRAVTQLTSDSGPLAGGGLATNRDPTWAPDDHIWFASTKEGIVADAGALLDAELYELDPDNGAVTRRTWTPHIERHPVFLVGGKVGGEVAFTSLRDVFSDQRRAHPFRFPPDMSEEYHQHFGATPMENLFSDMRETADGRYAMIIGDLDSAWEGGALGIIDRNFGTEQNDSAESTALSLPFYSPPAVSIDPDAVTTDAPGTLYRDPVGLPDGTLLAATASDVDLYDAETEIDLGIALITIAEDPAGGGPMLVSRELLIDEPGVSDFDPQPIGVRRPAPITEKEGWDPTAETGVLLHQGLPMIDAILENLHPSGTKVMRDDFVAVRLVESILMTPAQRAAVPADETRDGVVGATTTSLGSHGPARILAEIELAADGTFQAEIPAGTPFRIQGLDAYGMAVGISHNRWFDLHPGQVMRQGISGVNPSHYGARCAPCHGGLSGDPDEAFISPDVMTTASLTLSRYVEQDPRRPITPPLVGDAVREIDFVADVQPILTASCATGCHEGAAPSGGVSLSATATTWYNDAYETLLADGKASGSGKAWIDEPDASASRSFLIEMLTGRELEAPGALSAAGTPHPAELGAEPLDEDALGTLTRWIDLGATWTGTSP